LRGNYLTDLEVCLLQVSAAATEQIANDTDITAWSVLFVRVFLDVSIDHFAKCS